VLIDGSDCMACHAITTKINGPSYQQIAGKYNTGDIPMLVSKIKNGGAGVWGETPMAAHPQLEEADITEMVKYIMSLGGSAATLPVKGELAFNQHDRSNVKGAYLLTASYTDKGSAGVPSITATEQFVFSASVLEAENANEMHQDNTVWSAQGANVVGDIKDGHYMRFDNVLLEQLVSITFRGLYNENYNYTGNIEIRKGALDGELLGKSQLNYFTKNQSFKNIEIVLKPNSGKSKLFVVFKNTDHPDDLIANADYFLLNYRK
jgi:cytochrome c